MLFGVAIYVCDFSIKYKIDIWLLMSEMVVPKILLKSTNNKFDTEDITKSLEINVYPILYKLLQIILHTN